MQLWLMPVSTSMYRVQAREQGVKIDRKKSHTFIPENIKHAWMTKTFYT